MNDRTGLTDKEFYEEILRFADSTSITSAKKWYAAVVEVIVRNIYFTNKCNLPLLGKFSVRKVEEKLQTQTAKNGKMVTYVIPERIVPVFTPSDGFIDDVNMKGVTKEYRKRLKNNALTQRDYNRLLLSQDLENQGRKEVTEEKKAEVQSRFRQLLLEKKERHKIMMESKERKNDEN